MRGVVFLDYPTVYFPIFPRWWRREFEFKQLLGQKKLVWQGKFNSNNCLGGQNLAAEAILGDSCWGDSCFIS